MYSLYENELYRDELKRAAGDKNIPWGQLERTKVLITGATGLMGSFLVDLLMYKNICNKSGITVYALGRDLEKAKRRFFHHFSEELFHFVEQDVCDSIRLEEGADYIIHGASPSHPRFFAQDPVGTMLANFSGMHQVLRYALQCNSKRVLYLSSGEVYGEPDAAEKAMDEQYSGSIDCMNARACYPSSKRAAETLCVSYARQYGVDAVVARPCHVYGPSMTDDDSRAIAQFIRNALWKKDIIMKSLGTQVRSHCYVSDCVRGILTILLKGEKEKAYNIADSDSTASIWELAELAASVAGTRVIMGLPDTQEKKGYSVFSRAVLAPERLEQLGWHADIALREGIERTVSILKE